MNSHRLPHEYPDVEELNPYQILGVSEDDDIRIINSTYRKLINLLHPDKSLTQAAIKLGWTDQEKLEAFNKVKKAYDTISKKHKMINAPDYEMNYNISEEYKTENIDVNENNFNEQFELNKKKIEKMGYSDPYNEGYSNLFKPISQEEIKMIKSGSRPDIKVETTKQVKQNINQNQLAIITTTDLSNNYGQLGITKISDYSFSNSCKGGSFCGTDLKQVYEHNNEYWEDTVNRNKDIYNKYNDTTKVDKKINLHLSEREHIKFDPNIDIQLKQEELRKKKMEQLRLFQVSKNDDFYNKISRIKL